MEGLIIKLPEKNHLDVWEILTSQGVGNGRRQKKMFDFDGEIEK